MKKNDNLKSIHDQILQNLEESIHTANAGGSPPRTSPSPPVLLHGATSDPTKTMFIPIPQTTTGYDRQFSSFGPFRRARQADTLALVFTLDRSTRFRGLNPWKCIEWPPMDAPLNTHDFPSKSLLPALRWKLLDIKWEALKVAIGIDI
ncbi:hypothetical protein ACLOJK_004675 [Asimina triloba]